MRLVRVLISVAAIQRSLGDHDTADKTAQEAQQLAEEIEWHLWDRELHEVATAR